MKKCILFNISIILCCIITVLYTYFFMYKKTSDFDVRDNIYNYRDESFKVLRANNVEINEYNKFVDCNATSEQFLVKNIEMYKMFDECNIDVEKLNYLIDYYNLETITKALTFDFDYKQINKDNYVRVEEVMNDSKFNPEKFMRYISLTDDNNIMKVNLNYDLEPYVVYDIVDTIDVLSVVNGYNRLNDAHRNNVYCVGYSVYDDKMCEDYKLMVEELKNDGIYIYIIRAFHDVDLFDEHATGLAIDIEYVDERHSLVERVASEHGFILRYKQEYEDITGKVEEKHYRYVGEYSKEIYDSNYTLEQYLYLQN